MHTGSVPTASAHSSSPRRAAPLRRIDREWLTRWSAELDPRSQPSVSGAVAVAWLLQRIEPAPLVIPGRLALPRLVASD